MNRVILKFPNENEFNKFMNYLKMPNCEANTENLEIICAPGPVEIEIATKIFNAKIIPINGTE